MVGGGERRAKSATRVWEDKTSCIAMSENPVNAELSRHINTQRFFIRDLVRDGLMKLIKCAGTHNVADALTKSLPGTSHEKHGLYLCGSLPPFNSGVPAKVA